MLAGYRAGAPKGCIKRGFGISLLPIEFPVIGSDSLRSERIGGPKQHGFTGLPTQLDIVGEGMLCRLEHHHLTQDRLAISITQLALPVTPAGRLGNAVEPCSRAPHHGETDVDAGLDERGGNEPNRLARLKALLDQGKDGPSMPCAHQGR